MTRTMIAVQPARWRSIVAFLVVVNLSGLAGEFGSVIMIIGLSVVASDLHTPPNSPIVESEIILLLSTDAISLLCLKV